jgi:beta-lactamase superfamily II metal-dependent hydrolase
MKNMLRFLKIVLGIFFIVISISSEAQTKSNIFPAWQEGEMEIHHIFTGRGESVFCIFPDGTNMLIDAGDIGPYNDPLTSRCSPNESRQPGEWIARYISRLLTYREDKKVDYAFLTHFHSDHMGGESPTSPITQKGGDYRLIGLSEVAEYIPFKKLIDRGWPNYQNPNPPKEISFGNYKRFVDWNVMNSGLQMERFQPGSNTQFSLLFRPEKYPGFEVRNIIVNGEMWTGLNNETINLIPEGVKVDENKRSSGIRISYGDFDYFNGGDINGRITRRTAVWSEWLDIETPVGKVLGPIEVCEANHHAFYDAMNEFFIESTQAQIFIIQVVSVFNIDRTTINAMSSKRLYPGERLIIPTQIPEIAKNYIGELNMKKLTGDGGHVVVKVKPGGKEYSVYLLTTQDESMQVKSVYGPFKCKNSIIAQRIETKN